MAVDSALLVVAISGGADTSCQGVAEAAEGAVDMVHLSAVVLTRRRMKVLHGMLGRSTIRRAATAKRQLSSPLLPRPVATDE